MATRINNLFACLAGCFIAAILGLLLLLKLESPALAMLTAGIVPAIACWLSGITDKRQLVKIAIYGGTGWVLTFMLQPAIAQSAASHTQRIATLPLFGNDWHIPASIVSTLLALIGVYFVPDKLNPMSLNQTETGDTRKT